jgi:competence protein ComGC
MKKLVFILTAAMVITLTGVAMAGEREDVMLNLTNLQKRADEIQTKKIAAGCSVYDAQLQQIQLEAKPWVDKLNEMEKKGEVKK